MPCIKETPARFREAIVQNISEAKAEGNYQDKSNTTYTVTLPLGSPQAYTKWAYTCTNAYFRNMIIVDLNRWCFHDPEYLGNTTE